MIRRLNSWVEMAILAQPDGCTGRRESSSVCILAHRPAASEPHCWHMKLQRTCVLSILLVLGSLGLCGCATTGQMDTSTKTEEDKQWDDMTTAQQIGYCLWWPLQWGLLWGGLHPQWTWILKV